MLEETGQKITEKNISIHLLERGEFQPRQQFDEAALKTLAESIRQNGILQALLVRPILHGRYEIIAGERRWRAAQLAGLHEVSCRVGQFTDQQAIQMTLVENLEREDLNPIELAQSIERIIEECDYTHDAVATILNKSRSEVTNLLRLLKLDSRVQILMKNRELSESHGKLIASLPKDQQYPYARDAVVKGWSMRKLDQAIKNIVNLSDNKDNKQKSSFKNKKSQDPNLVRLEQKVSDHIGYPLEIEIENKNKGFVKIRFNSLDELEGIFNQLGFKDDY